MATIVMDAEKVWVKADNLIKEIEEAREVEDEKTIYGVMYKKRTKRKFIFFKECDYYFNREQAIAWLDTEAGNSPWGWRSIKGWQVADKAKALRLIAEHGDPVTLNQDDVEVLFG
jgi:hypothetical protein